MAPTTTNASLTIGFTGGRGGASSKQLRSLRSLLAGCTGELHHGDCIGADASAHSIALALGFSIFIHPPADPRKRAFCAGAVKVFHAMPYLVRNVVIVRSTSCLIACPHSSQEQLRSGTWSTIRFARSLARPVFLILPDGSIIEE